MQSNQLGINGCTLRGRHRWEAAVLGVLVQAAEKEPGRLVSRLELEQSLIDLGQPSALNRAQWLRLWSSLEHSVDEAVGPGAFAARFQHRPRCKTVGPWGWRWLPGDAPPACDAASSDPTLGPTPGDEALLLHRLTPVQDWPAALKLLRKLALCHVVWAAGSHRTAVEDFQSGDEWTLASPEVLTHRSLYVADALVMLSRFDEAEAELARAMRLIRKHRACNDQAAYAAMLASAAKGLRTGLSPIHRGHVLACLHAPTSGARQLDYVSRAWTLNLAARSFAESALGDREPGSEPVPPQRFLAFGESAVVCALLAGRWDVLTTCLEALAGNFGIVSKKAGKPYAVLALETHLCTRLWREKLDPTDSLSVGDYWLGELWSTHPWLAAHADALQQQGLWVGLRPDTAAYTQRMAALAARVEDPIQMARASLVAYKLCVQAHRTDEAQTHKRVFEHQVRKTPGVLPRLRNTRMLSAEDEPWLARVLRSSASSRRSSRQRRG